MRFYKYIQDNYIVSIGTGANGEEITSEEYEALLSVIRSKPTPPDGYDYHLMIDGTWQIFQKQEEEVELSQADDMAEALRIIYAGVSE